MKSNKSKLGAFNKAEIPGEEPWHRVGPLDAHVKNKLQGFNLVTSGGSHHERHAIFWIYSPHAGCNRLVAKKGSSRNSLLGGGFTPFLFSPRFGEDSHSD